MAHLYFIGGSKGGVGKSMVSIALCDYLTQHKGQHIKLIESDTSNPDVGKIFAKDEKVEVISCRLDDADGWIELVNLCDGNQDDIVVNSAARANEAIAEFGGTLTGSLDELKMDFTTFWVINRQRDSIELLKGYMESVPAGALHVVRNMHFGAATKFELYNNSKLKGEAEKRGSTIDFPDLADRVSDAMYSQRLSVARGLEEMPLGNKAELKRWRNAAWQMFASTFAEENGNGN